MRVQQEVVRHHDGGEHVVEVVGDAAGELADRLHLLRLVDLVLQRAPLGGLEHVHDGGFGLVLGGIHRRDEELAPALLGSFERHLDRRDVGLALRGLVDGRDQKLPVARIDRAEDRLAGAVEPEGLPELGVARVGAHDVAAAVDGRDRHRRMVEEAHEAHFGGAVGIAALVAGAADDERARRPRCAVGAEGELVIEPHRHGLAGPHAQVDVEDFRLHLARHRHDRGEQRGAVAGDDVGELQPARADLGEIVVEPVRQCRVDIGELACRIDREEAAGRVIEIFDRVLEFLEHVLLALAVAGDVGDRPHRVFRLALPGAERAHPHAQPAALAAVMAGDAHLFLLPFSFARGLEQAEHGFGDVGVADEDALDGPHLLRSAGAGERQIGGVGIDHVAAGIGHGQAVEGVVGNAPHHGIVETAVDEADDAGGEGEQVEQANHRQHGEDAEDIGLRLRAPERHQPDGDGDEAGGYQQHQRNAARARRRLVRRNGLACEVVVGLGSHFKLAQPVGRESTRYGARGVLPA
ncbi:hypothetical protein ACVWZR_007165 [Bradyrhizobium sp. i1.3.1]